jgi:hypothetical protein
VTISTVCISIALASLTIYLISISSNHFFAPVIILTTDVHNMVVAFKNQANIPYLYRISFQQVVDLMYSNRKILLFFLLCYTAMKVIDQMLLGLSRLYGVIVNQVVAVLNNALLYYATIYFVIVFSISEMTNHLIKMQIVVSVVKLCTVFYWFLMIIRNKTLANTATNIY